MVAIIPAIALMQKVKSSGRIGIAFSPSAAIISLFRAKYASTSGDSDTVFCSPQYLHWFHVVDQLMKIGNWK